MLERAKGCLEQGGRQLLRIPKEQAQCQRRLRAGFWSHGASQIDLSTCWLALLSPQLPNHAESRKSAAETARRSLTAGLNGNGFLSFLYPAGTIDLLHKLATRNSLRHGNGQRKPNLGPEARSYSGRRSKAGAKQETNEHKIKLQEEFEEIDEADAKSRDRLARRKIGQTKTKTSRRRAGNASNFIDREPLTAYEARDGTASLPDDDLQDFLKLQASYNLLTREYQCALLEVEIFRFREEKTAKEQAALEVAERMRSLGYQLLESAGRVVTFRLFQPKDIDKWTDPDWRTQMHILGQQRSWDASYPGILTSGLEQGKADFIVPILTESLIKRTFDRGSDIQKFWEYFSTHERWKATLTEKQKTRTPSFWEHLLHNEVVSTKQMILRAQRLIQDSSLEQDSTHFHKFHESTLNLFHACIERKDFGDTPDSVLRRFYFHLQELLTYKASYETLLKFLKAIIQLRAPDHIRFINGRQALKIFQLMERNGGYITESDRSPDLARKLFWRLCKADELDGAIRVFRNIQARKKEWSAEYSVLSFKLAKAGRSAEVENIQAENQKFLERLGFENKVGQRSSLEMYHDRMNANSRRYDLKECVKVFEQLSNDEQVEPNRHSFNIMIGAFLRIDDVDNAQKWFSKLLMAGFQPDYHSYARFLRFFARRGDVDRVRLLTREMEEGGIGQGEGDAVIQSHVIALLQAGSMTDAENLVKKSSDYLVDDRTILWDALIGAYASRGDRMKVNLLLMHMRRANVSYSSTTWVQLIRMWCHRQQPGRAESVLLEDMMKADAKPTAFHYAIVMKGFVDMQNPRRAVKVYRIMTDAGIKPDWNAKRMLARALLQAKSMKHDLGISPETFIHYEKATAKLNYSDLSRGSILSMPGDLTSEAYVSAYFQFMITQFPGSKEIERVEGAWDAYLKIIGLKASTATFHLPPISVANRLLTAYRRQKMWQEADKCWDVIYKKALAVGQDNESKEIVPARKHILCQPLFSYMRALALQGLVSTKGQKTIISLLRAGFRLDNRCWNQYVRNLVIGGSKYYVLAFETAEQTIMADWKGWPHINARTQHGKGKFLRNKLLYYASRRTGWALGSSGVVPVHPKSVVLDESYLGPVFSTKDASKSQDYAVTDAELGLDDGIPVEDDMNDDDNNHRSGLEDGALIVNFESDGDRGKTTDNDTGEEADKAKVSEKSGQEGKQISKVGQVVQPWPSPQEHWKQSEALSSLSDAVDTSANTQPQPTKASSSDGEEKVFVLFEDTSNVQGVGMRRPEYSTLVYLTRAFLDLRLGAAFEDHSGETIRRLSRLAPTVVQAILTMPRIDDDLQKNILRRR